MRAARGGHGVGVRIEDKERKALAQRFILCQGDLAGQDDLRGLALNLMRFFEHESCGQCTPCRVGTEKAVALMQEKQWNRQLLEELAVVMADASICGLGQAAPNPLLCTLRYFPEEFES